MNKSDQINELSLALSTVQGKMTGALKDTINPYFKKNYADLTSCWESVRALLSENNLALIQVTDEAKEGVIVETILSHKSGQWISGRLFMNPIKNDPQGIGICISYARRYAMAAMLGIVQIDDDANSISHVSEKVDNVRSVTPTPFKVPFPKSVPQEMETKYSTNQVLNDVPAPKVNDDFYRQALLTAIKAEGIPSEFVLEGCHKTNWIDKNVSSIADFPEGKAQALLERLPKLKETWLKSQEVK